MQNKTIADVAYGSFRGGALGMLGVAFARMDSNSMAKNVFLFSLGIALLVASEIVFRKYNIAGKMNPNISNPKLISFGSRYPFAVRMIPMAIGILIMVVCLHCLDAV